MPEAKIAMSVREPAAGIKVIDINGELTAFCEPVLTEAYGEADQPGVKTVILNFEGLDYMNSGGIGSGYRENGWNASRPLSPKPP